MASDFFHLRLSSLSRRPVLTAMMVFLLGFGAAAFALWRGSTCPSNPQKSRVPYLVQAASHSGRPA